MIYLENVEDIRTGERYSLILTTESERQYYKPITFADGDYGYFVP